MGDTKNNLFNQKLNLSTLFFARPMMYSLNTFGKSTIVDIRNKHYETGFNKCELDEDYYKEGRMFLTYNNKKGHKNFPIRNWQFFLDSVRKSKLYINEFDSDINFTTFYLNFPERWLNDYKKTNTKIYTFEIFEHLNLNLNLNGQAHLGWPSFFNSSGDFAKPQRSAPLNPPPFCFLSVCFSPDFLSISLPCLLFISACVPALIAVL